MKTTLSFVTACVFGVACLANASKVTGAVYTSPMSYAAAKDTLPSADTMIFESVEVEPSVDVEAWKKHLEKYLQPVVEAASSAGMKPGQYEVNVRFLVNKDGRISDVKALNNPGYGLAAGAARVVRTGPKWKPGQVNGRPVRSYHTQPITFVISK